MQIKQRQQPYLLNQQMYEYFTMKLIFCVLLTKCEIDVRYRYLFDLEFLYYVELQLMLLTIKRKAILNTHNLIQQTLDD